MQKESAYQEENMKTAVIGVGNMGSKYASLIQDGKIEGLTLCALTRVRGAYRELLQPSIDAGVPVFESADDLFAAVERKELAAEAVIIATPHYSHEELAVRAFRNGLHVLSDKPAGVYSRQGRIMDEEARRSGKVYSMVFNQRTLPVYRELKKIVDSGKYGALKRMLWVVTDWYRPNSYYTSSSWHATWDRDGGGVLLNQCPHNLDLLQWILGMPVSVQGFCREGRYHPIEVEDDVTAYMEWENGASGTFITSTGEAPGINRLEISLEDALIVCENGEIRIGELFEEMGGREEEYRKTSTDFFRRIRGTWIVIRTEQEEHPYEKVLQAFSDECRGRGKSIASGREGRGSLLISNAIYLSSWENRRVRIPAIDSGDEIAFEMNFEEAFKSQAGSRV